MQKFALITLSLLMFAVGSSQLVLYAQACFKDDVSFVGRGGSRLDELASQLESMVWQRERVPLLKAIRIEFHAKLNQSPFDYRLWRRLVAVEAELKENPDDLVYALEKAFRLGGWHDHEVYYLAAQCFQHFEFLSTANLNVCRDLVARLPSGVSDRTSAHKTGVTLLQFQRVRSILYMSVERVLE